MLVALAAYITERILKLTCPHCLQAFFDNWTTVPLGEDAESFSLVISHQICPGCERRIIKLSTYSIDSKELAAKLSEQLVYPRAASRIPLSRDVPPDFAQDYKEACLVLADSPKASAALSRRCLQHIIHDKLYIKKANLDKEIQELLDTKAVPSYLAPDLDAVRHIGNFAAHPIKSTNTGEIVDVEPGEAEWLLDVLEGLFDFIFVGPANAERRREALNSKLADAGKPALKQP